MKKIFSLLLSVSVIGFTAQAQLEVGLKLGVNMANQASDVEGFESSGTTGLYFGVPVRIALSDNLVVQPEIAYMQKGSGLDYTFEVPGFLTSETTGKSILNYVEIPIMVQYLLGSGDIKPYVTAGPSIGLGMGYKSSGTSKTTTTDIFTGVETTVEEDFDDSGSFEDAGLSGIDFSIGFGGGVIAAMGPGSLSLNLLYNLGLANIYDDKDLGTLNNRGLLINVGYSFPLN